ncbi:hypothetical protein SLS64_012752 [Diaporthe eres]|uniref:C2H2-type domain-containing protein n=1 Tax=Diaporthe eres TaxID=83184 RepID=A0ABR1P985_DIAER
MEGMIFPMGNHTHINYSDVEKQFRGEFTGFPQDQWSQQDDLSSFMPDLPSNSPQEYCAGLEITSDANLAHDPSSPASTDATMVDTPTTSAGSSPSTSDSPVLECGICHWRPDTSVKRSLKKLTAAVEKHITRNHRSKNSQCPICYQVFKNRPDNVKPHVTRKHPERLASLYPTKAVPDDSQNENPSTPARTTPKKRASQSASPPGRKHMRFQRR